MRKINTPMFMLSYGKQAKLDGFEIILWSFIHTLNEKKAICTASNRFFASLFGKNTRTIRRMISRLKTKGFLTQTLSKNHVRILRAVTMKRGDKFVRGSPSVIRWGSERRSVGFTERRSVHTIKGYKKSLLMEERSTSKDVHCTPKNRRADFCVFTHSFSAGKFSRNKFTRTNKTGTPARTKNQENLLKEKTTNAESKKTGIAAGKEKDTTPVKSSDVFRAAAPVRTGRKFMPESEIPKTAKGRLKFLSGSKTFVKSNVDMDILRDAYLREALEIWNSYPGVSKHKIERTKTIRRIRKYLYLLLEGNLYRDEFEPAYIDRNKLHSWLRHRFTRPEVTQMLRRARSYYLPRYEPMNKDILPKRFDRFLLRRKEDYYGEGSGPKESYSWFLQACSHKPELTEDMPETVNPKYAHLEELFDDVFLIRTRADRIDFNRGLDALEKYRAEVIFPEVYRVSCPEKDSECPPGRSQYEITYGRMFWTLEEMMEKYRIWLREPRQEWIHKDRISWLFDPNGQYFLRFIDYTARNNYRIPIIPGREYDDYGDDVYYYNANDNR